MLGRWRLSLAARTCHCSTRLALLLPDLILGAVPGDSTTTSTGKPEPVSAISRWTASCLFGQNACHRDWRCSWTRQTCGSTGEG